VEDDRDIIIFDPNGFGELTISIVTNMTGLRKRQKASHVISDWAEELGIYHSREITVFKRNRDLLVVSAEFMADEPEGELIYWRIFPVIGDKIALDVSYSCPVEDRDREETVIETIVDSIRLIEPKEEPSIQGQRG
jgi:hypothetical protein